MSKTSTKTQKINHGERMLGEVARAVGLRDLRWHDVTLPGTPDVSVRSEKLALFFHGCFWHAHTGCSCARLPRKNRVFWERKFARNRARDRRVATELKSMGYSAIAIWECAVLDCTVDDLAEDLRGLLDAGAMYGEIWSLCRRPILQLAG